MVWLKREIIMATDYHGNAFLASERVSARYLEADAHRLANISKKGRIRDNVLKDAGQALYRVVQAVLCKLDSIWFMERLSPCSESSAGYHKL
jgi:hypothetical protein